MGEGQVHLAPGHRQRPVPGQHLDVFHGRARHREPQTKRAAVSMPGVIGNAGGAEPRAEPLRRLP